MGLEPWCPCWKFPLYLGSGVTCLILHSWATNITFPFLWGSRELKAQEWPVVPTIFFSQHITFIHVNEKHKEVSCKSRVYDRLIHNLSVKKLRQVLINLCTSYRRGKCTPFPFKCSWSLHYYSWLKKQIILRVVEAGFHNIQYFRFHIKIPESHPNLALSENLEWQIHKGSYMCWPQHLFFTGKTK